MARGLALTIGLNSVNPRHYAGRSGKLNACEADAKDMADIVKSRKFSVKTLLTKAATRAKVTGEISRAARMLKLFAPPFIRKERRELLCDGTCIFTWLGEVQRSMKWIKTSISIQMTIISS